MYQKFLIILDFSEFLIAISITAQQDPKKKLEWAFSMYGMYSLLRLLFYFLIFYLYLLDIDRNGFIEKKEMRKIMDVRINCIMLSLLFFLFIVEISLFFNRLFMIYLVKKRKDRIHLK